MNSSMSLRVSGSGGGVGGPSVKLDSDNFSSLLLSTNLNFVFTSYISFI